MPFVRIHDIFPIRFWIRTTEFGMCQSFCWGLSHRLNFCKCCYYRGRIFFPKWCNPEIWGLKKDTCISFNSVSSPKHLEENIFSICMSPALRWPSSFLVMRWKVQECSSPGSRCPYSDGHGQGSPVACAEGVLSWEVVRPVWRWDNQWFRILFRSF